MQHRLYDCNWQMRLPRLGYASEFPIALTTYLAYKANGGRRSRRPGVGAEDGRAA